MTDQSDIVERLKTLIALHPFAAVVHTNGDGSQIIISEYGEYAVTDAIAEITRLREALAEMKERCAKVVEEEFGKPYALKTSTGAMMFRAVTDKIAATIRGLE